MSTESALQRLTLGEVAAIENLSGMSIKAMAEDDSPMGKMMAAMAYVIKRRSNPDYTFADAMNLTMEEANEIMGVVETDPTE